MTIAEAGAPASAVEEERLAAQARGLEAKSAPQAIDLYRRVLATPLPVVGTSVASKGACSCLPACQCGWVRPWGRRGERSLGAGGARTS
jgi:hypothetical protein